MKALKSIIAIILLYVISYQVCAQSTSADYNSHIPKKLTFQIEVILGSSEFLSDKVTEMFPDYMLKETSDNNIYLLGVFPNEKRAELYQKGLSEFGYSETNVVAFFRQKKISMQDALSLANNYNRYDDEAIANDMYSKQYSKMIQAEVFASNIHYSVELDRDYPLHEVVEIERNGYKVALLPNGNFKVKIEYKSYYEALANKQILQNKGIEGIQLYAYSNTDQIEVLQAKQFEESYNSYLALTISE